MKPKLPTRRMVEHPDLDQLKHQAKELLRGFVSGDTAAAAEVNAQYDAANKQTFALHDAQLALARSYGFESWPKLKAYVDGVTVRRLAEAVRANDLTQVRSMLKTRPELADMQMSYGDEHRPIHFAVMARLPEMVRLLMQHGADARAGIHPHRDATKAWTLAKEREYPEIVAIIEEEERRRGEPAPVESPWRDGGPLTAAVRENQPEMLRSLLDSGLDPNERVSEGEGDWVAFSGALPLWHAVGLGRREMAEMLLEKGADPNMHVDSSGSSVFSAYMHRQWDMIELLRRHGGVVTADIAAIYRETDRAREILAENPGAAQDLLHFGASGGDPEIVRMALEHIDWPRTDPRWFRQLDEPLFFWHHIPWLSAGNKDFDRSTYLPCFRLILERCDPNVIASFGRTILHEIAAMRDHITDEEVTAFASAVLDAGARTDFRDDILKSTPLGWACRWGRGAVVRALVERGADPVEADAEPWARPRAWAEKMGHRELVDLLSSS